MLGLLMMAVISLGCNQAIKNLAPDLSANIDNDCALLAVSFSSGNIAFSVRPLKNITGYNHNSVSQYTSVLRNFNSHIHSFYLSGTGRALFNSLIWRHVYHKYYLQDLSPPLLL